MRLGSPLASKVPKNLSHPQVYALVALAAVAVYLNTLSYGAAWDDSRVVLVSGADEGVPEIPSSPKTSRTPAYAQKVASGPYKR